MNLADTASVKGITESHNSYKVQYHRAKNNVHIHHAKTLSLYLVKERQG